ncbi:MAG: type II toxin-antitoxin system PemK/MazF family toxin [Phycisphaerae bacterium]|nr:type II toxin-antitoxin system PemK/MazF family toxin [Phycisphaerae bacterium]
MTGFKAGDVVLVRFPFTDLETKKRRPALVVNPVEFSERYGDVVILPLTGREQNDDLRLEKWREAGLLKPTWLKPLAATITESLIEKTLGILFPDDEDKVGSAIRMLIDTKFIPR